MATATNPNQKELDLFTQAFINTNDPAKVGTAAAQREYTRLLAENTAKKAQTSQTYSDLYNQMKSQSRRNLAATNASGFTGGMATQQRDLYSAAEMSALGNIGVQRQQAMSAVDQERQSAWSNALLVGQQQADYARANQTSAFNLEQQAISIANSKDYSDEQKKKLLRTLGLDPANYL